VTRWTSYIDESRKPYPFCPGCGHGLILDQINAALVKLQIDPRTIVVVLDIGCVSLCREFLTTNWMLGLHGRSVTYASGIKLANPNLKVFVLTGDGGVGIGGNHVINAARRNMGITVVLFNNLNFGMTGGEHSVTTPPDSITSTTEYGHLEQPLDVCATVAANGASYVARTTTFDENLSDLIAAGIANEGFSLVDVWEFCTAYYVPNNRYGRRQMEAMLERLEFRTGVLRSSPRPEYSRAYRQAVAGEAGRPTRPPQPIEARYTSRLSRRVACVISGAAGKKINTAAALLGRAAVGAGLWATQRSDYPVTVKTGYSISEVVLSPERVCYSGVTKPDLLVVLFPEVLARARPHLDTLTPADTLYLDSRLAPVQTAARQVLLDFGQTGAFVRKQEYWATMAVAAVLRDRHLFPLEALEDAIRNQSSYAEENLAAVAASEGLIKSST
jgi:pyruvate/2-oxoacid:ferredoxin oxidoreductase beta subunit/Pyruvate/2-oxoacid:ferredoxin oxidoreductase gamma subunit